MSSVEDESRANEHTRLLAKSDAEQGYNRDASLSTEQLAPSSPPAAVEHEQKSPFGTARLTLIMSSTWLICVPVAMGWSSVKESIARASKLTHADSTIMATLSVPIANNFDSLSLLSWIISSYLIATAAFQPISGGLTDAIGRRNGLALVSFSFLVGNLICGLANNQWSLLVGRIVSGIGGGCINTITTIIATDLVPLKQRGVWQGYSFVVYGFGTAAGGPFGGWVNSVWGWRWTFLAQVPFILIVSIWAYYIIEIPNEDRSTRRKIDFSGAVLLISSLILLLSGVNSGGNTVSWSHPLCWATLLASVAALTAFIFVEVRVATNPIIPVRVLLNRTAVSGCLMYWFGSMASFGFIHYAPIFLQVTGRSVSDAALFLIPTSIGTSAGSLGCGVMMRLTDHRRALIYGLVSVYMAGASIFLVCVRHETSAWLLYLAFMLIGLGHGSMLTVIFVALISSVPHKHHAAITSAAYAFRSTGSVLGVTLCGLVFQNMLNHGLQQRLGNRKDAATLIRHIRKSLDYSFGLPEPLRATVLRVYCTTFSDVAITILVLVSLTAFCSLFVKNAVRH